MHPEFDIPHPPGHKELLLQSARMRKEQTKRRIRKARWWKRLRMNIHQFVDGIFQTFLTGYELPRNSRWTLFAQLFWIECPICFFYRGATFGFMLASAIAALVFLIVL